MMVAMNSQDSAQDGQAPGAGGIPVVWILIVIIMLVALWTTVHGFFGLSGSYVYAVPLGIVAQAILLIVSLNIGRDIAHWLSGRPDRARASGKGRLRGLFLAAVYVLFFGI